MSNHQNSTHIADSRAPTADTTPINTRAAWRPVLRPITAVVIAAQLALVLQPLSALAQEKGQQSFSPLAQNQLNRINLMSRDIEAAKAQKLKDSASPADKASNDLARIEEISKTLHADLRARGLATLPARPASTPGDKDAKDIRDLRAIGPNIRIETQRSPEYNAALRLQDKQRQEQLAELKDLLSRQSSAQAAITAEFQATRLELEQKKLPAQILARHDEAAGQFAQRATQFNAITQKLQNEANSALNQPLAQGNAAQAAPKAIANTSANTSSGNPIEELHAFFAQYPNSKRATSTIDPANPKKLPWSTPEPTKRAPAETKTAWLNHLHKDYYAAQSVQLAQAGGNASGSIGGLQFTQLPEPSEAPTLADLAETAEVKLTAAIRTKALELGHNPVQIHSWVRNTLQWQPTWGSMQSADSTLQSQRGNSTDIASLEIALLRAAGIPARYQFGTIDITAEQAMNWVGGVTKPETVMQLLGQGGIANRGLVEGGRFAKVRMEHVWVQAYVNWAPSRGAKQGGKLTSPETSLSGQAQHVNPNGQLNAWVPLDASFKQYSYTAGLDLKTAVPLDANALLTAAQQGATVNANFVQNLNQQGIAEQLRNYQNRLQAAINSSPTGASSTVGDVLGAQTIKTSNSEMLAGTLQYPVVSLGSQVAELPEALRWKVRFSLYQSDNDRASDSPSISVEQSLAQLSDKRISISYEAASPVDQAVLDTAAQNAQISFSGYLVRFTPKIKIDFDVLGTGYAQQIGTSGKLNVVIVGPNGEISRDYTITSGDTSVLVLNPVGTSAEKYANRARYYAMNELDTARYGFQGLAEEMLHQLGLAWWAQKYVAQANMASLMGVVQYMLPSHTLLLTPVSVRYFFGTPRSGTYKSRVMDAKLDYVMLEHKSGDANLRREFVRAAGKFGSYMEGAVFDQAFNPFTPNAISTISLIGQAHTQGEKVYRLKPGDEGLVSQLQTTAEVKDEIVAALYNGHEVTVPEREVSLGGYTGIGYIIEDPNDGSAAYQIDGGRSGAEAKASDNVIPIPAMPDSTLIGILLGSTLRGAGAKLAVDAGGMIIGLVLPIVGIELAAIGLLIGALIILFMLAQNLSKLLEQTYPAQTADTSSGNRWRKYTRYQDFIIGRRILYASSEGTFGGGGVYVADTYAEERRGVICSTLSPLDIATRFQINSPIDIRPGNITGYVDIVELRKDYLKVKQVGPNTAGQLEYLITKPIIFVPELRSGFPVKIATALILTPGIVEIDDVCVR